MNDNTTLISFLNKHFEFDYLQESQQVNAIPRENLQEKKIPNLAWIQSLPFFLFLSPLVALINYVKEKRTKHPRRIDFTPNILGEFHLK